MRARLALIASIATLIAPTQALGAVHLSQVGTFTHPVFVTAPPGDPHRLFVVEQAGRIMEVRDGQQLSTAFLDIQSSVQSGGEMGLLSMAFAPDYATSGRFYVYYTAPLPGDSAGDRLTIEQFSHAAGNFDSADPASGRIVLTVDHPGQQNHNGGQLEFGPDGFLYAGTGDGGGSYDSGGGRPSGNAQNCSALLGKLLRISPLPDGGYIVPPDNGCGGGTPVFDYGLRNPWRFSFDRSTGDLVIADVGQGAEEEVDFQPHGRGAGVNYGWVCLEGNLSTGRCPPPANATAPVFTRSHSGGVCAIVGGYVVRDPALGSLAGRYVYGDNCAPDVRSIVLGAGGPGDQSTGLSVQQLSSFGEDSCGHVYAASLAGPVYRIDGDSFTPCPEPPPPGASTPPPPGASNGAPPALRLTARRLQRVLRQHGFRLSASCDKLCGLTVGGRMRIGHSKVVYVLRPVTRQVAAGSRTKVTLRLSRRGLRAATAALSRHGRVSARLIASARDSAGGRSDGQKLVRAAR